MLQGALRAISNPVAALLEPGYKVDRYELLAKIGQGGMASVWLAREEGAADATFVAIKTILPRHASDEQLRKMMLDEARITMAIDHPNVARTIEVGTLWDMPYLVLEYVSGESLDQLCQTLTSKGVRVPAEIAVRIVTDTCAGLHAAHEAVGTNGSSLAIVHRDLSPPNILVDENGIVKLIDFGIAKAAERLGETESGVTKGKVPYMAPEQALDAFVDRRADIWSLGAVLYMLLAGKYPFDGPNDAARLSRKLSGDPPPPLPDSIPLALRKATERALSFYREARFDTAADLAVALGEAVRPASTGAVKEFFAQNLGPAMKARALIVQHALSAASARERARELLGATSQPPSSRRGSAAAVARTGPAGAMPVVTPDPTKSGSHARRAAPARPWIAYVSAAAIALILLVAFALGTATERGRGATPTTATTEETPSATRLGPTATPHANESATVPSLEIASASASSPSAAHGVGAAPVHPPTVPSPRTTGVASGPVTTPAPVPSASVKPPASARPGRPGRPEPEDTIF